VSTGGQVSEGAFAETGGTSTFSPTADGNPAGRRSTVLASTIEGNLNNGTNVTIQTVSKGTDEGSITVNAVIKRVEQLTIGVAPSTPTLKLDATGRVLINQNITAEKGDLNLELKSANGGVVIKDGVTLDLNQGNLKVDLKPSGDTPSQHAFLANKNVTIKANEVDIAVAATKTSGFTSAVALGCVTADCVTNADLVNIEAKRFTINSSTSLGDGVVLGRNLNLNVSDSINITSTAVGHGVDVSAATIKSKSLALTGTSTGDQGRGVRIGAS
jgi:hypothetical protein